MASEGVSMMTMNELLNGYENTKYYHYDKLGESFSNSFWYDELPQHEVTGVLKACRYVDGRLLQTYSEKENHVGVIAATRLGKTTSYVVPTVLSFARAKNKKSMIISDPKGEIYRHTASTLQAEGYEILFLNFRDYKHSECWNPLTPIYRKYHSIFNIYNEIEVVDTENGPRNRLHGKIYESQVELDEELKQWENLMMEEVGNDIDNIAAMIAPTSKANDPYWEDSGRELLKAFLWAMLEDGRPELLGDSGRTQITEETYSFATIITLIGMLSSSRDFDGGYFSERPKTSRAYQIEKSAIPEDAKTTRQCITSVFNSQMSIFRECAMRLVTSCNSFDMNILTGDKPVALFIDYRDELKVHFKVISLFIQDAYRLLIEHANMQPDGKRKIPFYFILDEFGNFPPMKDFETTISACAGRNIFFILIVQSYAQLNSVYGDAVAAIIRDNLNMHIFFGSNNPQTLEEFSKECGQYTRIAPLSVLNGKGAEMDSYQFETIQLIPKSMLTRFSPGECIATEANCGYVLFSKLERYYLCKEFTDMPLSDEKQYVGKANPFDKKYTYLIAEKNEDKPSWRNRFDF